MPSAFSWIDHRLVREGHICRCSHGALALYLFLVTVADAEGLSYYSDAKAGGLLNMTDSALASARRDLVAAHLIAYRRPLYQVLALDAPDGRLPMARRTCSSGGSGEAILIGDVLREALGGAQ